MRQFRKRLYVYRDVYEDIGGTFFELAELLDDIPAEYIGKEIAIYKKVGTQLVPNWIPEEV